MLDVFLFVYFIFIWEQDVFATAQYQVHGTITVFDFLSKWGLQRFSIGNFLNSDHYFAFMCVVFMSMCVFESVWVQVLTRWSCLLEPIVDIVFVYHFFVLYVKAESPAELKTSHFSLSD